MKQTQSSATVATEPPRKRNKKRSYVEYGPRSGYLVTVEQNCYSMEHRYPFCFRTRYFVECYGKRNARDKVLCDFLRSVIAKRQPEMKQVLHISENEGKATVSCYGGLADDKMLLWKSIVFDGRKVPEPEAQSIRQIFGEVTHLLPAQ